jgi:hypothetical protein
MKKTLIVFLLLVGCATEPTTPAPTPTPSTSAPTKSNQTKVDYQKVIAKSSGHKCYLKSYKNKQGRAPEEFLHGLIANFTEEVCSPSGASAGTLGSPTKDALAYYRSPAKIENLYALMIGSGMQESSGGYNCGQDSKARKNRTGPKAEAGTFQTSYNSIEKSKELGKLYEDAKANKIECFSDLYVPCTGIDKASNLPRLKNWGEGEGVNFQALTKSCQGFSAKYHSIMLRVDRAHYGPINSKDAEIMPSCVEMFSELKDYISANKEICGMQ